MAMMSAIATSRVRSGTPASARRGVARIARSITFCPETARTCARPERRKSSRTSSGMRSSWPRTKPRRRADATGSVPRSSASSARRRTSSSAPRKPPRAAPVVSIRSATRTREAPERSTSARSQGAGSRTVPPRRTSEPSSKTDAFRVSTAMRPSAASRVKRVASPEVLGADATVPVSSMRSPASGMSAPASIAARRALPIESPQRPAAASTRTSHDRVPAPPGRGRATARTIASAASTEKPARLPTSLVAPPEAPRSNGAASARPTTRPASATARHVYADAARLIGYG